MTQSGGGGGGQSAYNNQAVTLQSGSSSATGVDPYVEIEYTSGSASGTTVTTTTKIKGSQEKKLEIQRDTVGIHTVQCKISHPTAVNNPASSSTRENDPIWTNEVEFSTLSAVNLTRSNLTYEITKDFSVSSFKTETVNLFVQPMTLAGTPTNDNATRSIHIYPPEEDIKVKITLAGSAGQTFFENINADGGHGGKTVFTYTLLKNTEYTVKLGCTVEPTASIGRGGAGAFFYEGGRLLVCCGGGGGGGVHRNVPGGRGGGAGIAGEKGGGLYGGAGGRKINTGQLESTGTHQAGQRITARVSSGSGAQGLNNKFAQGIPGGRVESCTSGEYWRYQGFAPCEFVGEGKFRDNTGRVAEHTTPFINRGYKADTQNWGFRHNGGNSYLSGQPYGFFGGGGAGAVGGTSCQSSRSGGGGGSGYTNGSVTILESQLGGNPNSQAFCLIELYSD